MLKIYHNTRCSKSRQSLALLNEKGLEPQIIDYLKNPLSVTALKQLQAKLAIQDVRDMMRTGEGIYKELGLKSVDDQNKLIEAMAAYPKLLERPIVETAKKARIGRPPEAILDIL